MTEEDLVKKTWAMLGATAMAVLALKFGLDALKDVPEADRGSAGLAMWVAAGLATLPAAVVGWRVRHERPVEGQTSKIMGTYGGFAVLIGAIFLGLSTEIQVVLFGAGAGYMAGLVLGVATGVFPRWVQKWRRDFA